MIPAPGAPDRGPDIRIPPPVIFVGGFLIAWLLDRWLIFEIDGRGVAGRVQTALGIGLGAAGLAIMAWALVTFVAARTAVIPHRPARQLVRHGPYRWTRNPMYFGLTSAYVGLALVWNAAWPLVLLPVVLFVLTRYVVRREERYLGRRFGDAYADYRSRVRRWL